MITTNKEFKAKITEVLASVDIKGICDGVYMFINSKVESMPIGEERDFIEALITKAVIDHFFKAWGEGCRRANLSPHTIVLLLNEIQNS